MMDVTLREYIEALVRQERELREMHEKASIQALALQARETERRLEILNGEHGRLAEVTSTFLRQETFEAWLKGQDEADVRIREAEDVWRRAVNKQLDEQRGAYNRTVLLITIALAGLSLALRFWP